METLARTFIGIDVSKDDLATAFPLASEQWEVEKFGNNDAGIAALVQKAKSLPEPHVVLEATGNYSMKIARPRVPRQAPGLCPGVSGGEFGIVQAANPGY